MTVPVLPARSGFVVAEDARAIGLAIVGMGGGRIRADQRIDHAVGFTQVAPIGAEVGPDRPLCLVHARSASQAEDAAIFHGYPAAGIRGMSERTPHKPIASARSA